MPSLFIPVPTTNAGTSLTSQALPYDTNLETVFTVIETVSPAQQFILSHNLTETVLFIFSHIKNKRGVLPPHSFVNYSALQGMPSLTQSPQVESIAVGTHNLVIHCSTNTALPVDTVFFKVKDPSILESNYNSGLDYPAYYLIKATITNKTILNCQNSQYTFEYDEDVLHEGAEFTKASIDTIDLWNANTQYIKEIITKNSLQDSI